MSPETTLNELDWLAFQYSAGELDGAELDAFELRLATDLAACEAVAKAVTLCQIVATTEQNLVLTSPIGIRQTAEFAAKKSIAVQVQTVHSSHRDVSHKSALKRVLTLLGSAACLAWMVSWVSPSRHDLSVPREMETSSGLASLWLQGAEQVAEANLEISDSMVQPEAETVNFPGSSSQVAQGTAVDTNIEPDEDNDEVPGWLLAAVAEQQREMGSDPEGEIIQD